MDSIPYGFCGCGCGQQTEIVSHPVRSKGYKRGDRRRFLKGHAQRVRFRETEKERFLSRVDMTGGPDVCWPWVARREPFGYGIFATKDGERLAHRYAYALWVGEIPQGLFVLHSCDNPPCCNPAHLHLGTSADNMRERSERGRAPTGDRNGSRKHLERRPRGENHGTAFLIDADVLSIRELVAFGKSQRSLAIRYNVSSHTIWSIVHRRTWKHL